MDEDLRPVDPTPLLESDQLWTALDCLADGVYVFDPERDVFLTNDRADDLLGGGCPDADGTATTLRSLFGHDHERVLEFGEPVTASSYHAPTETWLEAHIAPAESGVTGVVRDVTDRREHHQGVERERDRMRMLNGVYTVTRAINGAIVADSTREELERITCETLAEMPACEFAFVATIDAATGDVIGRTEAGIEGYVESISLSTSADDPAGRGPTGRAIRTQTLQVSNDVLADPALEPWHADARERGYRSTAAVPIVHNGGLYGVLGVTSPSRQAFTGEVREGIGQLGEILGYAIASLERKQALMGDQLVELEYEIRNAVDLFDGPGMRDQYVSFERVVRVDDDRFLEYGVTAAETFPDVETLVERVPHWERVTVLDESAGEITFELEISSPPMFSIVADHGGYVESAAIDGGHYSVTIHLPEKTDVRAVNEAIQDVYPTATNVARRQVTPSTESIAQIQDHLYGTLTDRQRTVLETSYYAGFFEWPRNSSGEEIAETLGITPATFHEHLRSAQRKIVAAVFSAPDTTRTGAGGA